jgi:hypothetical protein
MSETTIPTKVPTFTDEEIGDRMADLAAGGVE